MNLSMHTIAQASPVDIPPEYFSTQNLTIVGIALSVVVFIILIYVVTRKNTRKKNEEKATVKELEVKRPNILDQREVVDEAIEINENMSLAEIKRAKAAIVRSKEQSKRATAVEATKASKEMHQAEALAARHASPAETLNQQSGTSELPSSQRQTANIKKKVKKDHDLKDQTKDQKTPTTSDKKKQEPKPTPRTLEDGLAKTRSGFIERLGGLFKKEKLDDDLVNEVEEVLYTADIGPNAASTIMEAIEKELHRDAKQDPAAVWAYVRNYVKEILTKHQDPIRIQAHKPFVFLMIGVNGVGKTTTIGKLASKFRQEGKSVLMVAGDTFRAAAVEQLEVWGERTGIEVYKGTPEQDPASVVYEGIDKAVKEGIDIVLCDTAGRLQSNTNLLDELAKINRVASKVTEGAPHETLLVLDANTGQNALIQARKFNEAVNISGIVLTKLDGTAKGGIILGICDEIDVPIRYIGIGESVEDLRPFKAEEFVEALFM